MLNHAACSVSFCGYNTALDILQASTPAVFVPFVAGNEVEQGLRAQSLSDLPSVTVLRGTDLDPQALAAAVDAMIAAGPRPDIALRDSGAAETVALCETLVRGGRP